MTKQRTLTEAEEKARKKYGGLTRRDYNAKNSKFANHRSTVQGNFELVALFHGKPLPDTATFPNEAAVLARFERLCSSPALMAIRVVHHKSNIKPSTIYSFQRYGEQECAYQNRPWWETSRERRA
jgi:hypothetical protein